MKKYIVLFTVGLIVLYSSGLLAADFSNPYGVTVDAKTGFIYVSNVNGDLEAKDDNGFISRLKSDGAIDELRFIDSSSPDFVLNAPKGVVVLGNFIYVCDIDSIRAFNHITKKFLFDVNFGDLPVKHFYSIIVGPDGALYVSDAGVNRIYRIDVTKQHEVTLFASGDEMGGPRGLMWHPTKQYFIVTGGTSGQVTAYDRNGKLQKTPAILLKSPQGIDVDDNGNIYLADNEFKSVYKIGQNFALYGYQTGVDGPAGIAYNKPEKKLIVAAFWGNEVKFYQPAP